MVSNTTEERQSWLVELEAKVKESQFRVTQQQIRAPVAGVINQQQVFTVGGVVTPAETLMTLVPEGTALAARFPGMHAWRSLVGVTSLGAWFYAIAHLPLATAMTLNYMSSVWIAAFLIGGTLLTWTPQKGNPLAQGPLVLTVLAGFAGALLSGATLMRFTHNNAERCAELLQKHRHRYRHRR